MAVFPLTLAALRGGHGKTPSPERFDPNPARTTEELRAVPGWGKALIPWRDMAYNATMNTIFQLVNLGTASTLGCSNPPSARLQDKWMGFSGEWNDTNLNQWDLIYF